jgi:hypothetical protein
MSSKSVSPESIKVHGQINSKLWSSVCFVFISCFINGYFMSVQFWGWSVLEKLSTATVVFETGSHTM